MHLHRCISAAVKRSDLISIPRKMTIRELLNLTKTLETKVHSALAVPVSPPLSLGEVKVLEVLVSEEDPLPIREIVARANLAQSWVSTVVKGLEKRGWVKLQSDPNDGRVTTVAVTSAVAAGARKALSRNALPVLMEIAPHAKKSEVEAAIKALKLLASA